MKRLPYAFSEFRRSEICQALHRAGRLLHWAGRLGLRLVEAIKDALTGLKVNTGIAISLLGKVCWLIPLIIVPHLFSTFPTFYREFAKGGPEWHWALLFLGLIVLDSIALLKERYGLQMATLGIGVFSWFFLAAMVAEGAPRGYFGLWGTPGSYLYSMAAVGCLVGLIYTGLNERAQRLVDDLLVWREFVEEESARGADWVRPRAMPHPRHDRA